MSITDLKFDDLRTEAAADNDQLVKDAVKRFIGGFDRLLKAGADEPDELIEHLESLTDQLTGSRKNLRARKPIAELSSGSPADTPAVPDSSLTPAELEIVEKLKASARGDLRNVATYLDSMNTDLVQARSDNDRLTADLRKSQQDLDKAKKDAEREKNRSRPGVIDGDVNQLRQEKSQLEQQLQKSKEANETLTADLEESNDKVLQLQDNPQGALVAKFKNGHAEVKSAGLLSRDKDLVLSIPLKDNNIDKTLTSWEKQQLGL